MSAPQTRSILLDGRTFVISCAPASAALVAAAIYANAAAAMVDGVRRARDQGAKGSSQKMAGMAEVLAQPGLASQVKGLAYTFAEFTNVVEADGRSFFLAQRENPNAHLDTAVFDRIFAGRVTSLWKWLQTALEHNLGDFLEEFRAKLAELAPDAFASTSHEPSPTTG